MIAPNRQEDSSRQEDPFEGELLELNEEKAGRLRELARHTGEDINPVLLGREAPAHWDGTARRMLAEYNRLSDRAAVLNSRRCSRQVSRFVNEINSGAPVSPEVMSWWLNRY